ncbi:hypothetical protein EJB05_30591, partial [Eragrostis curvula]
MSLRPSERAELCRSGFKASAGVGEAGRLRREHITVEIHRASRNNALLKRRCAAAGAEAAPHALLALERMLRALPQLAQGLYSDDISTRLEAARELRKLLSTENPPDSGGDQHWVVPCFVHMLDSEDCPELQFEAVWVLTNIILGTSENIKVVVDHNAAVWALGNIAGVSSSFRDIVLAHGALFPLLQLLNGRTKLSILRKATWALGNFEHVWSCSNGVVAIYVVLCLIQLVNLWLCSDSVENIQAVIESGVCPRLVELVTHSSPSVLIAALHVIGNIVRRDYVQAVINENIIGPLVWLMQTAEFDVKKNAAWAISNATDGGTHDQIKYLISQGCIMAFCNLLGYADTGVLIVCLKGLENILKVGEAKERFCGVNIFAQMIDDADGLEKIENLQTHDNIAISETAARLLMSYWLERDNAVPCFDPFQPGVEVDTLPFGIDFGFSALPRAFDSG